MAYSWNNQMKSIICIVMVLLVVSFSFAEKFMPVDELKPGMKGTGRTVFSGTEISEFGVEILGVLKNIYPKGDLILVRLENELLDKTGLIAGMSGSPVYIDGKLIGAVAYGWGFSKETIAGVTPIMEMVSVLDESTQIKPAAWHGRQFSCKLTQPISVGSGKFEEVVINTLGDTSQRGVSIMLNPIATPIMVSGFSQQLLAEMELTFNQYSFYPIQSGGDGGKDSGKFLPGAVVGAQLLCGDAEITALGTLTYCSGEKILAFGHPFLAAGKVDFPMTGGSVHAIVPSHLFSFKLGAASDIIGKISRDTRVAICGEVGEFARLIPARITVKTAGEKREFNYRMIHDEIWSPNILNWCVLNSILSAHFSWEKAARLKMCIQLSGFPEPVTFEDIFSKSPFEEVNKGRWQEKIPGILRQIMDNQFQEVSVEEIHVDIELSEVPLTAVIEGIRIDKADVKPGEDIDLSIILKPYGNDYTTLRTTVSLPEDMSDGEVTIMVCDAAASLQMTGATNPERLKPHSFNQLIELFRTVEKNNEIVVRILLPRGGITVRGRELPSLPGSLINIMSSSRETGVGRLMGEIFSRIPTQWVISGNHQLRVMVKGE